VPTPTIEAFEIEGTGAGGSEPLSGHTDDTEAAGIEDEFRRKLAGLRRLPRRARAAALRAACDTRSAALASLCNRRAGARHEQQLINYWLRAGPR